MVSRISFSVLIVFSNARFGSWQHGGSSAAPKLATARTGARSTGLAARIMGLADLAGWIALVATCVAAMMTAANLSARVTGWGFVIFTVGAAAWIVVGLATHQTQLLYSNIFLAAVDVVGVWRWLGRRARISDAAQAEVQRSAASRTDTLFSTAKLDGLPVKSKEGETLATPVDALAACVGGQIDFLIIRAGGLGGVGETLFKLPWSEAQVGDGEIRTSLTPTTLSHLSVAVPE